MKCMVDSQKIADKYGKPYKQSIINYGDYHGLKFEHIMATIETEKYTNGIIRPIISFDIFEIIKILELNEKRFSLSSDTNKRHMKLLNVTKEHLKTMRELLKEILEEQDIECK